MTAGLKIPVYVVDDEDVDRMIVRKRLERSRFGEIFEPVLESDAGDAFLDGYSKGATEALPPLVLMDVNMPRMDGFETIKVMEKMVETGEMATGVVVMMFTSSQNPKDQARSDACDLVKGYIVKPLCEDDIEKIIQCYKDTMSSPTEGADAFVAKIDGKT